MLRKDMYFIMNIEIKSNKNGLYTELYSTVHDMYKKDILKNQKFYEIDEEKYHHFFFMKINDKSIKCAYQKKKIKILNDNYYFIDDENFNYSNVHFDEVVSESMKLEILDNFEKKKKEYTIAFIDFPNIFSDEKLLLRIIVYENIEKQIKEIKKMI